MCDLRIVDPGAPLTSKTIAPRSRWKGSIESVIGILAPAEALCTFVLRIGFGGLLLLLFVIYPGVPEAHAQNATWLLNPGSGDFNTAGNWSPAIVPVDTATFGASNTTTITVSSNANVGTLDFLAGAPAYFFNISPSRELFINGAGIVNNSSNRPTFNNLRFSRITFLGTSTAGNAIIVNNNFGVTVFLGSSTAGNATITNLGVGVTYFRNTSTAGNATITNSGGATYFLESSTAGNAIINNLFPSVVIFYNTSTAGNATITNSLTTIFLDSSTAGNATITTNAKGITFFRDMSTGGDARLIANAGGIVDISGLTSSGMTAGSIEGAGAYQLGSKTLTVGLNDLSTEVSGRITDGGDSGGTGGALIKVGTGTLTLLGDNTYSGGTTINDGTLVAGTVNVAAPEISTALGVGNVLLQGGTLRSTSITTGKAVQINVGGNYTQGGNGTLALGIGGVDGFQYDQLQVSGTAKLNGTLAVSSLNGFRPGDLDSFEIVRANRGLINDTSFARVVDTLNNNPSLERVDVYAPNGVALLYVSVAPAPPGTTPSPIEDVEPIPLPIVSPNAPLSVSFLLQVLDPTVEQLSALFEVPFSGANTQRFNLNDRMMQIQQGSTGFVSSMAPAPPPDPSGKEIGGKEVAPAVFAPSPTNRFGVWVNGWGDWVSLDSDNGIRGYDFSTGGASGGIDYRITDSLAVGLFGTYAHTWTSLDPGSIDVNTGRGGLYATYWNQGFYVNGGIYGGHNSYETSRQTLVKGDLADGSTSGCEFSTFADTGYNFHFQNLSFGPLFAAEYTNVHIDGYSERASFLPLNIHSDSEESWRTDLGLQASYSWHLGQLTVMPSLWAAWEHEYKYSALPITFSDENFPGATTTVFGPSEGHDSAILNAGVGVQWTPRISTYVGYQGQLGRSNYSANGVTGTMSFSF